MYYFTYISKANSIIRDSELNTGINPIQELIYGKNLTRILYYFDHSKIKEMMEDGTFPDHSKITHRLKIKNAGSVDFTQLHTTETSSIDNSIKRRASSFDLIFFLVPKAWDAGKGFDYSSNALNEDFYDNKQKDRRRLLSTDGCNWYQARNGIDWDEEGVYSNDTLSEEYNKFSSTEGSKIVFARQRFEVGNESIDLDITNIVNKFVYGELTNYGIGVAFSPLLERLGDDKNSLLSETENYVGFFGPNTNTYFEPYVVTHYNDFINDDRSNFVLNKDNRLYLYCNLGGTLTDLDQNPTVTIKDDNEEVVNDASGKPLENIESTHYSKGIYYIDLKVSSNEYDADTMLYDTWDNIVFNGSTLDPVELDVTLKNPNLFFNVGNKLEANERFTPSVGGINDGEDILRGDKRKVNVYARMQFTSSDAKLINGMEYRLYIRDGLDEMNILPWEPVNKTYLENYFVIDTSMLLPQKYYVDIKIKYGMEEIIHHDVLHFKIVNDTTNRFA